MPGASAIIEIDSATLRTALDRLVDLGERPGPILDEIGAAMVQRTQERFHKGEGPGGAKWQPSRRALKEGGKTLIDTARLMQSIAHRVTADGVEWGTNVVYAAIHQFGGVVERQARTQTLAFGRDGRFASRASARRRKGGAVKVAIAELFAFSFKMPARPYIGFDETDRKIVEDILGNRIAEALAGGAVF